MELDRGTLANVDRQLLSGLDHAETHRVVRLPASDAVWSTWRRYCDAIGISMGRAIAALIVYELRTAAGELRGGDGLRLAHRAEQQTAEDA